jgi:hypothetical protein
MQPGNSWFQNSQSQDRRRAERYRSPRLVAYYYWDEAVPVAHPIRDISAAGLYVLTKRRWYPGTLVIMRLQRTDQTKYHRWERSITVQAKVVWWGADGFGVEFVFPKTEEARKEQGLFKAVDQKILSQFVWRFR